MNRIYFDTVKNLEVCDVSGIKPLEQLKKDFNAPNLADITADRMAKTASDKTAAEAKAAIEAPKEKLIAEKIRAQAITALKAEGKLDAAGDIIKGV